jgi:glutamate racemase
MSSKIGIYDSGLGGLSIVRAVRMMMPRHDIAYLADSAYFPYGPRPTEEVRDRARACAAWLIEQGAGLVVVACNTASSAALETLRGEFISPIVGMEPGVKPASLSTHTRRVGVLATNGTLAGGRFARLVRRFAEGVNVQAVACPDLVEQVEAGELDTTRTRAIIARYLCPLREEGVDTIVLGCTHFHFVSSLITELAGPGVTVIDTAPAVARRVLQVAEEASLAAGTGSLRVFTTGTPAEVSPTIARIWSGVLPLEQADC